VSRRQNDCDPRGLGAAADAYNRCLGSPRSARLLLAGPLKLGARRRPDQGRCCVCEVRAAAAITPRDTTLAPFSPTPPAHRSSRGRCRPAAEGHRGAHTAWCAPPRALWSVFRAGIAADVRERSDDTAGPNTGFRQRYRTTNAGSRWCRRGPAALFGCSSVSGRARGSTDGAAIVPRREGPRRPRRLGSRASRRARSELVAGA
jgi:hypothetical protein